MSSEKYEPLTIETLANRLVTVGDICKIVGNDKSKWKIDEVGDGNLNLVYTVSSDLGNIIAMIESVDDKIGFKTSNI